MNKTKKTQKIFVRKNALFLKKSTNFENPKKRFEQHRAQTIFCIKKRCCVSNFSKKREYFIMLKSRQ